MYLMFSKTRSGKVSEIIVNFYLDSSLTLSVQKASSDVQQPTCHRHEFPRAQSRMAEHDLPNCSPETPPRTTRMPDISRSKTVLISFASFCGNSTEK